MADFVFVRANINAPIREGEAVSMVPLATPGTGAIIRSARTDAGFGTTPSGTHDYAMSLLATRFRYEGYYAGNTGAYQDNSTGPNTF
jgi:hypothetical protein